MGHAATTLDLHRRLMGASSGRSVGHSMVHLLTRRRLTRRQRVTSSAGKQARANDQVGVRWCGTGAGRNGLERNGQGGNGQRRNGRHLLQGTAVQVVSRTMYHYLRDTADTALRSLVPVLPVDEVMSSAIQYSAVHMRGRQLASSNV